MPMTTDDTPENRSAPERKRVVDQLAAVLRDQPADSGFGDHLASTVHDLRSWTDDGDRERRLS
jgi:hypothetical protein